MRKELSFSGKVERGDSTRCGYNGDLPIGAVFVGGKDVAKEVYELECAFPGKKVFVAIQELEYSGTLDASLGWGYSEDEPMDYDDLFVGGHNIIDILKRHEGQDISVRFRVME